VRRVGRVRGAIEDHEWKEWGEYGQDYELRE
jgi:hypothetical protein